MAIQFLPLFLSEALIASSVGITAILAVTFLKVKLSSMEKLALPGLMIGLVLLALSAQPEQAQELALKWRWLELACVAVVGLLALGVTRLPERRVGIGLAIVSGVAFSGMGIAARSLEVPDPIWEVVKDPTAYAIVIYGALGLLFFASALQRATVTTVTALVFGIETVLPSLIGILFLGDRTRDGLWPLAVIDSHWRWSVPRSWPGRRNLKSRTKTQPRSLPIRDQSTNRRMLRPLLINKHDLPVRIAVGDHVQ